MHFFYQDTKENMKIDNAVIAGTCCLLDVAARAGRDPSGQSSRV
jgi:hypothetical protein